MMTLLLQEVFLPNLLKDSRYKNIYIVKRAQVGV